MSTWSKLTLSECHHETCLNCATWCSTPPMHTVLEITSATMKLPTFFDAFARCSTGILLNDQLLVGPMVHAPLIYVLFQFHQHRITLTTDISRMYCAILPEALRDLHHFVWRRHQHSEVKHYRMTRLSFGVLTSSFTVNMEVRMNAIKNERAHP